MPRRRDAQSPPPVAGRPQRPTTTQRVVVLAALVLVVSAVRLAVNEPSLALSLYILLPVVLSVFWFDLLGGLITAGAATLLFLADELASPSEELAGGMLWVATVNRLLPFVGVAVLVAMLLRRERALTTRVQEQETQLTELEGLRAALVPTDLPETPHLEIATSFTPADGLVAGDFFLVAPGPSGTTTVAVGDVVGHGIDAARCAAFVRASLATYARFTSDPAQLLQLANIALVEHSAEGAPFVTAVCVNVRPAPDGVISWAAAGHDVPWRLDSGDPLPDGKVGAPLGTGPDALKIETSRADVGPGEGILAFTDGLTEGRTARRAAGTRLELFGEERARQVVRDRAGAPPAAILEALSAAVQTFAGGPLADDLCLVAVRVRPPA
jgi:sigma-B regulation protein RsbU (phosphoserine phosphatase)